MTCVAHPYFLRDSEVRKRENFRGALLVKDLAAVAAVMFPVGESEGRAAPKADVRINPVRSCLGVHHRRAGGGKVLWGECEA
jgi:hypothetical protein